MRKKLTEESTATSSDARRMAADTQFEHHADCQSAIQQTASLHYVDNPLISDR